MKGLKKYDASYRITDEWVNEFRDLMMKAVDIIDVTKNSYRIKYEGYEWILTNNGLEFNLTMVNLWDHKSIPYVNNGKAVDVHALVLGRIVTVIKEDARIKNEADNIERYPISDEDAEYMKKFLDETRRYE